MSGVLIRPLEASDLHAVARLHLSAFPGSGITRMGAEAARRFYLSLLTGPHDAVALGAFDDELLVGFCFGGIWRDAEVYYLRTNLLYLIGQVLRRSRLLSESFFRERIRTGVRILLPRRLTGRTRPLLDTPIDGCFGIQSIAVDPAARRHGVGRQLLQRSEETARSLGFKMMDLSVHTDNEQAISFYEGLGWRRNLASGIWGGVMIKDLD